MDFKNIEDIIEYNSESSFVDFKREEYPLGKHPKKNEILKDFSAFANHFSNNDKYIFIGIKEKNGSKEVFEIQELTDDAKYQEFVFESIEPKLNFEYKSFRYQGKKIAYFRIFDNKNRPYLFKKDLQNPSIRKVDFKQGDGYIKIGSSTKKIDRSDLEKIYKKRLEKSDRKSEISVESVIKIPENEEYSDLNLRYIDINISNLSNKSIDLNVEMKIYKNDTQTIIYEEDFQREMQRQEWEKNDNMLTRSFSPTAFINLHTSSKEDENQITILLNTRNQKSAITLNQNSKEFDIFCQNLLVFSKEKINLEGELIIRSDDFTEGALIEKLNFIE